MRLSIITINYNNAAELEKTILSVKEQAWQDFEYIVIDGGSTDNSVDTIKQHQDRIQYWVSEKDKGIYHAMNKGIAAAQGDYLYMLNSGDLLADNQVLSDVFQRNDWREDILYGDIRWMSNGQPVREGVFPDTLTLQYFWNRSLAHQAAFIKKSVHQKAGLYDEELRFGSDWKLFVLAICKYGYSYRHLNRTVCIGDCNGLTWRSSNFPSMKAEKEMVLQTEFPIFYNDYAELASLKQKASRNKVSEFKRQIKGTIKKLIRKQKSK